MKGQRISGIVRVPPLNYIAVCGKGNPNDEIGLLYGIKGSHKIDGYFQYVAPPLEGFWWQDGIAGIDYRHKEKFNFL